MNWIVDADDFCEENSGDLKFLSELKSKIPSFKVTLFTIFGRCSEKFYDHISDGYDWIDLVPHGWMHPHPYECSNWDYEKSLWYLKMVEHDFPDVTRGFKAPGWQISDGMYRALLARNWWVADQTYNDARRPRGLRAYLLNSPFKLHFHCGKWNDMIMPNSLTLETQQEILRGTAGEYAFVKDVV